MAMAITIPKITVPCNTAFQFTGKYDELPDPTKHKTGDIAIVEDTEYILYGSKWEEFGKTSYEVNVQPAKIKYPSNCKNCGAVLHSEICEYCGTEYGEADTNITNSVSPMIDVMKSVPSIPTKIQW